MSELPSPEWQALFGLPNDDDEAYVCGLSEFATGGKPMPTEPVAIYGENGDPLWLTFEANGIRITPRAELDRTLAEMRKEGQTP